jgi:hypothetical protein
MPPTITLKRKERPMDTAQIVSVSTLVLTLLNLGLVIVALSRLNGLRKDLRTPVVKKFNADYKRKSVDIPKPPENFSKPRDDKSNRVGNQSVQNRPKNNQQSRPAPVRRPVAKAPAVFSNEVPAPQAPAPVPPRPVPVATEPAPLAEGRRPLPPRFNVDNVVADPVPQAPVSFVNHIANDEAEDTGMEFDRSKMAHGRRNVVAKPIIEDDAEGNT